MPAPLWQRFWNKVEILPNGCWRWTGAVSHGRRGRRTGAIKDQGRVLKAHRLALIWAKGPPPPDKPEAGHKCPAGADSLCINPTHLEWVSRIENEADKRVNGARP